MLHGGAGVIIGDLTAAAVAGLRSWHRDDITVLVPHSADVGEGHPGVAFVRTRRPLRELRRSVHRIGCWSGSTG
ncbi:hypothetical protein GCM10022237_02280 [Nocardioides ginsengisoli]|uniref:Uncharacterized protein n=1 Tax=Nocardioides ginsengisoli TaxID=363868 RepID=A0ABW3W6P5_9ACTN